jgi:hypothetical protein
MKEAPQVNALISGKHYESITHFIAEYVYRKITRRRETIPFRKLTFSISLSVIFILLLLFGLAGNYIFGLRSVTSPVLSIFLLGVGYIYILCIVIEFQVDKILMFIREHLLDALVGEQDQQSLFKSLSIIFSFRRQFLFGITFSVLAHIAFIVVDPSLIRQFGIGFLVVNIIFHAFHGFCIYYYFAYLGWTLSDLKNYQYDLFDLDPSSTEIISKIAGLLQSTTYLNTFIVASATIILSTTRVLPFASVGAMVFLMWTNAIALYFLNRHIMKRIILSAKWEKLTEIQHHICELESAEKIPSLDTLEHINKLKEYHDKILDSPDSSPGDIIKFLNTLNTLIWPTFGIFATNISDFLEFMQTFSKFISP